MNIADMLQRVALGAYLLLLVVGMVSDLRWRRVPNWLVLAIMAVGVVGALLHASVAPSLSSALLAGLLGLVLWLPFWLLGLLGAGDVKYFAASSCWLGVALCWRAALVAAVLGGVMSLLLLVWQRGVRSTIQFLGFTVAHLRETVDAADVSAVSGKVRTFPYAVPMGLALTAAALWPASFFGGWLP